MVRWIVAFIDRPAERFGAGAEFWTAVTATRLSARRGRDGEFATLLPLWGDPHLKLQAVREGTGVHLDLEVDNVAATAAAARELGATLLAPHGDWAVLRSPGGWPFCLQPWDGAVVKPPPATHPDGTVTRADQVCVDIGPGSYEAEAGFWAALTGWERKKGALPEFEVLQPPDGMPMRLLLQRLRDERPTSAHLDLACSDVPAARAWHERHGARMVARRSSWVVMNDPAGGVYCLTDRHPAH